MTQLHELLAAEKTVLNARDVLTTDTTNKFQKAESFFSGFNKSLEMLNDTPEAKAIEAAAKSDKSLPTTVYETLAYYMAYWSSAEDVLFRKNTTNTQALANIYFRGQTIADNVPVDELMGLESRLIELRKLFQNMPTLDASKDWRVDPTAEKRGTWRTEASITSKTEKQTKAVVLYEATDKHPAQIKEVSSDVVVGSFKQINISGAATALQKAETLAVIDELVAEVKKARARANSVNVVEVNIGKVLTDLILAPLTK